MTTRVVLTIAKAATLEMAALGFWISADHHLRAARRLRGIRATQGGRFGKFGLVPLSLCAYSIELALKAFLRTNGVSVDALKRRPFGHDLKRLWRKAKSLGIAKHLNLTSQYDALIMSAEEYHDAPRRFQYFDIDKALRAYDDPPEYAPLLRFAGALLQAIEPMIKRS